MAHHAAPPSVPGDVQDFYANLQTSANLKTSACSVEKPHPLVRELLGRIPDEIMGHFYGCGAPVPLGIQGLKVLDLGSGSGRDSYLAAALVGQEGHVTGVDMTPDLVQVSQQHVDQYCRSLGYAQPNIRIVEGLIEDLGAADIQDGSVDLVISNCVINLCPDKERVFQEAFRVLAHGGEMYFSDMYATRRLSPEVKAQMPWGEGLPGAMYIEDFKRLAASVGFRDVRLLASRPITVSDPHLRELAGETRFLSLTFRLFKLPELLEAGQEDYGQQVTYKGTIPGHSDAYVCDQHHTFVTGKPMRVSGNSAAMLGAGCRTWLAPHFEVAGSRSIHQGQFGPSTYLTGTMCAEQPVP